MEKKKFVVFRFDDKRVRCFKEEGTYEIAKSNGVIYGTEQHLVEVDFVEGTIRRKIE